MDVLNYYTVTLGNAFKTLMPVFIFAGGAYLFFIQLPFLFLRKSLIDQKKKMAVEVPPQPTPLILKSEKTQQNHSSRPRKVNRTKTPEDVFQIKPGEPINKLELKKRYFSLLKENHPDRVASMGKDFKILAEKNTREINEAYESLLNKLSS